MALTTNQLLGTQDILAPIGAEAEMEARQQFQVQALIFDNATAGTVTEFAVFKADAAGFPNGVKVVAANAIPSIAITAADATAATVNVNVKTTAGAAVATAATVNSKTAGSGGTGNMTALNQYPLTITAANAICASGNVITVAKTVLSTGTAISGASVNPFVVTLTLVKL